MTLETVVCDLCQHAGSSPVSSTIDHEHGVAGSFQVVRCDNCGLCFLNPRPDAASIGECYPSNYYAFADTPSASPAHTLKHWLRRGIRKSRVLSTLARRIPSLRHAGGDGELVQDIPEWIPPGRVLDVGCGAGRFLDAMAVNGWTTAGIEPSADAADAARGKGHAVACQSASDPIDPRLDTLPFEVIHMSHALEHMHSPSRALRNLRPLLAPRGHLIIEVPNVESLLTYWFGELGLAFDTPRHLYLFDPDTLRQMLERNGYTVRSLRHIARPVQFARCLRLLAATHTPPVWRDAAATSLDDPALMRAFTELAAHAARTGAGGAIRAVATPAESDR